MKLSLNALLILVLLSLSIPAASQRAWYVGIHMGTGYYQLYNKNDWNADPLLINPVRSSLDNWRIGATTTYTGYKHLSVSSGLLLSKDRQEFQALKDPDNPNPQDSYSITDEFHYLKFPLNIQYSTHNEAKHQLVVGAGLQTAFLLDYREHFRQVSGISYYESEIHNRVSKDLDNPSNPDGTYSAFLFKRLLLGLSGTIGYRFKFYNGWLVETGVRGEYDLTNAENRKAKHIPTEKYFWTSGVKRYGYGGAVENRPKTHNRSIGLFLSVSIPVDVR